MKDIKIDGKGLFNGGEYDNIIVDGMAKCEENIKANTINIDGGFKCLGNVNTSLLDCDGSTIVEGYIQAKKIIIGGIVKSKKMEAEEIICDGMITVDGQISADYIKSDGLIVANEIVGDNIIIKHNSNKIANIIKNMIRNISKIELIEATRIEIYGVKVKSVNGENIIIGKNCEIDNLDCNGNLFIHPTASVKNIMGNYTLNESH